MSVSRNPEIWETPSGVQKPTEEVFDWNKIPEDQGLFIRIPKDKLQIDHKYQRTRVNNNRINNIARSWSWRSCGVLVVIRRADGSFMVVDGQHRLLAARKRASIQTLPCLVFDSVAEDDNDLSDEAIAFKNVNCNRGNVAVYNKFIAGIQAGEHDCQSVQDIVTRTGYRIVDSNRDAGTVACVDALLKFWRNNPSAMARAWGAIAKLADGQSIGSDVVRACFRLEQHLYKNKIGSISEGWIWEAIRKAGYAGVVAAIKKRCAEMRSGSDKYAADGIVLDVINRGRRTSTRIPTLFEDR